MIKRLLLLAALVLPFAGVTTKVTAEVPFPQCLPCPPEVPPAR
jgi:hypothetical protein